MQHNPLSLEAVPAFSHDVREPFVERIGEGDVADDPVLEERERADSLRAVDDRIRDHEVAGLYFFAEGADGAERDDGAYADGPEGGDVSARGDLMRSKLVVDSMSG